MDAKLTDHASLIAELGGAARVAEANALETRPVNVRAWAARNRIPPEYWPGFISLAASRGVTVTADWLMRTTPARATRTVASTQVAA